MNSLKETVVLSAAMGAVIFFCRAFPFLFFSERKRKPAKLNGLSGGLSMEESALSRESPSGKKAFLDFVEKTVPPAAMTVLAFNAIGGAFRENLPEGLLALAASVFTALLHLWKRNPLVSIFGGTALYMILRRVIGIV